MPSEPQLLAERVTRSLPCGGPSAHLRLQLSTLQRCLCSLESLPSWGWNRRAWVCSETCVCRKPQCPSVVCSSWRISLLNVLVAKTLNEKVSLCLGTAGQSTLPRLATDSPKFLGWAFTKCRNLVMLWQASILKVKLDLICLICSFKRLGSYLSSSYWRLKSADWAPHY